MIDLTKNNRLIKILSIISFLLIIIALLIILLTPAAEGYEISIYNAFPGYFWFLIIVSCAISTFIILNEILKEKKYDKIIIRSSFILLSITLIILLFLPIIRGYATYGRGDVLSHIGYIKDIILFNNIPSNNWYPMVHITGSTFLWLTDIPINVIVMAFPPIFASLYILGMFLLSKEFFNKKIATIICLLSFFLLRPTSYIGFHFTPSTFIFFLFPLMLYVLLKSARVKMNRFKIITLILFLPSIIFHPLRALFFILILLLFLLLIIFLRKTNKELINKKYHNKFYYSNIATIIILGTIVFNWWYLQFHRIISPFKSFFFRSGEVFKSQAYIGILTRVSPNISDLLILFLFRYGVIAIIFSLTIFISLMYIKNYKKFFSDSKFPIIYLIFFFSIFLVISGVLFLSPSPVNYERFLDYSVLASTIIIGFVIYNCKKKNISKKHFRISVNSIFYISIISIVILSTLSFFPSHFVRTANHQVTEMELLGMYWTFENRNDELSIVEYSGHMQRRFHDALYGRTTTGKNVRYGDAVIVPDHFGYNQTASIGELYEENNYLIIFYIDRISYPELYPDYKEYWRYKPEDFEKLEMDQSIHKIYENIEYNTYLIYGSK